jgi:catalase
MPWMRHSRSPEISMKFLLTTAVSLALAFSALPMPSASAQDKPVEAQAVDALITLFGAHPGKRSNHAKGVMLDGTFTGTAEGAALSKAGMFGGTPVRTIVRFSDPTGIPDIPDNLPDATPKGMGIKFYLPDGSESDMALISSARFPVSTVADFRDLILAVAASPKDAPKPTKIETFLGSRPAALEFIKSLPAIPASFATESFYGLNAFKLTAKGGQATAVRFRFVPVAGEKRLSPEEAAKKGPNFLMEDIRERAGKGNVQFTLMAQIAEAGDKTNDATVQWPDSRKLVAMGTLTLNKAVADSEKAEKAIVFLPGLLAVGIEASDDPLIPGRDGAYADSFTRRNQ